MHPICLQCSAQAKWQLEAEGLDAYACNEHLEPIYAQFELLLDGQDNPQATLDRLLGSIKRDTPPNADDE